MTPQASAPPWRIELDLSPEAVASHIERHFPQLAPARPRYLGEGYDTVAFELEGGWVFKFAKRQERVEPLLKEGRLMTLIAPRLPLPVPAVEFMAEALEGGGACIGYRKVGGLGATRVEAAPDLEALAPPMAAFMAALQAVPAAEVRELVWPGGREILPEGGLEQLRACAARIAPRLEPAAAAKAERFARGFAEPDYPALPDVLVHSDLTAVHIQLEPGARAFAGVIDFGDACLGHPMADFPGLLAWFGEDFIRRVLRGCKGGADERHLPWIKARAAVYGILEVEAAMNSGNEDDMKSGLRALEMAL